MFRGPMGLIILGIVLIVVGSFLANKYQGESHKIPKGSYPFWFFGGMSIAAGICFIFG